MPSRFYIAGKVREKMQEREVEINVDKKYDMPDDLKKVKIGGNILVISPSNANWILLENKSQEFVFEKLKTCNIENVINMAENENLDSDDVVAVLTQIEAKDFLGSKSKAMSYEGLCLYLTNQCNLRCPHCYMFSGAKTNDELTLDEIKSILREHANAKGKVVTFTGGEVTQRKDLTDILSYAKSLELLVTVLSNGVDWDRRLIKQACQFIDEIQISLDGYDEKSNSLIRGRGNFEKAMATIDEFYNNEVKTTIAITPIMPIQLEKYIDFGKKLLEQYDGNLLSMKFSYELIKGRDVQITDIDSKEYTNQIKLIVNGIYPDSEKERFIINHNHDTLLNNCGYGGITIASNGDIYLCNRVTELKCYGNIRSMKFHDIIQLSKWAKKIADVDNLPHCKDCELRYICGGGCRLSYFPEIIHAETHGHAEVQQRRPCSQEYKMSIYKMMMITNEAFFR